MNEWIFCHREIVLSRFHHFCDIRVPVFIGQRFEIEVIAQRVETEVSECGVLLDNECWSLRSLGAQILQVDIDVNCECTTVRLTDIWIWYTNTYLYHIYHTYTHKQGRRLTKKHMKLRTTIWFWTGDWLGQTLKKPAEKPWVSYTNTS